jgi:Holliday junction resolvase RusA-like endonuclease
VNTFTIEITEHPVGYSNKGEKKWREAIREACIRKKRPEIGPPSPRFEVTMEFRLAKGRCFQTNRNDLDNLVKPVVDTLFATKSKKFRCGILFNEDDTLLLR